MTETPVRVLFLCTHNSARSQIAEGLLRFIGGERFEVVSAGTEPGKVDPLAIHVLAEVGIDISAAQSKNVARFVGQDFDYVITVCDRANESCPLFPGDPERIHWSFPDPATAEGPEEVRLAAFRKVRDELRQRLRTWITVATRRTGSPV